jgi:hypothetical protein
MIGLVTAAVFSHRLHCSECGQLLRLKSGGQVAENAEKASKDSRPHGTGDSVTFIEPCQNCIEIAVAPARALKAALDLL